MFCSNCGTRNEEGTSYCVNCGAEQRKIQTPGVEVPPPDAGGGGLSAGSAVGYGASVPNYLVQAILLTTVCLVLSPFTLFFPFLGVITGIVAIVYGRGSTAWWRGQLRRGEGLVALGEGVHLDHVRFRGHRVAHTGRLRAAVHPRPGRGECLRLAGPRGRPA